jgi:CheY-like chemotaxis protein
MVFSDIKMPKMDGIAFLKQMKAEFENLPICMISGFSGHAEKEVMDLGAAAYLSKPYSIQALVETAKLMLGGTSFLEAKSDAAKQRIYVVEDDAVDRAFLQHALGKQPWKETVVLKFFDSGEMLLWEIAERDEKPAVLILDINLPGLSGIDTLLFLKAENWLTPTTRVLILSGLSLDNHLKRCKELAVDAYYQKPFSRDSWWHLARSIGQSWLRLTE